jgi:hypothetical protein
MKIRGLLLRESLKSGQVPDAWQGYVTHRYTHLLGGVEPVEVVVLMLPPAELSDTCMSIAMALKPTRYYAHFVTDSCLYVIFPYSINIVPREDAGAAERCRQVGTMFGIPLEQMKFEALFEVDHPNSH